MNHDVLHYGNNTHLSNIIEMSIPCSQSNHLSTSTHTLRQWRKKDVLLGTSTTNSNSSDQTPSPTGTAHQSPSPGAAATSSSSAPPTDAHQHHHHIMAETVGQTGGQIARVAPHNHYPRGTTAPGGAAPQQPSLAEQLQQQHHQQQQLYLSSAGVGSTVGQSSSVAAATAAAHAAAARAQVQQHHSQYSVVGHHQYGGMPGPGTHHPGATDYSYTPYKDSSSTLHHLQVPQHAPQQPTPVKYSEIVEPPNQTTSHHSTSNLLKSHQLLGNSTNQSNSTKDHHHQQQLLAATKEYQDMCSQQQMVPNQQQQYNPQAAMMKHHQYLPQPPHPLSSYYKHPSVHQYHQRCQTEANNYLADLNKIAPQMAQSIMNDPHLRGDPNQMYPSAQAIFEPQRGSTYPNPNFQQQQRLYGRPVSSTSTHPYHPQKPPGSSLYPPPRGNQVKQQTSPVDPYRNMHLYQPTTVSKYPVVPPQPDYTKQLQLLDFNRRSYPPESMHYLNYAVPSKISPTSYNQCTQQQQYEYSQHYQQNRHHPTVPTLSSDYHQMSVKNAVYLHHEQEQLQMPDLVRDNTPKSSNSLKQYLESWNDEDLVGTTDDSGAPANSGSLDLVEKPLLKIGRPAVEGNEHIYVLDSTAIPTETVSQYLQHVPQIDKLPDNIKFYPEISKIGEKYGQYNANSMDGILNLTSSSMKPDYSPPSCLRAEEPLNIRPVLDDNTSAKPPAFLSLPVIDEDDCVGTPIRASSRVEDPVLASTGAREEDTDVVVPTPRINCVASPEMRSDKSSPELSFEAIGGGSVIVPNITAQKMTDIVAKVEESFPKEDEVLSVKSDISNSPKVSEVVPKDDMTSPVKSVDGETLDLSVNDVSASIVADKVVPDIEDNTVINVASQNRSEKVVETAINLSLEDKEETIANSTIANDVKQEVDNEVSKELSHDKVERASSETCHKEEDVREEPSQEEEERIKDSPIKAIEDAPQQKNLTVSSAEDATLEEENKLKDNEDVDEDTKSLIREEVSYDEVESSVKEEEESKILDSQEDLVDSKENSEVDEGVEREEAKLVSGVNTDEEAKLVGGADKDDDVSRGSPLNKVEDEVSTSVKKEDDGSNSDASDHKLEDSPMPRGNHKVEETETEFIDLSIGKSRTQPELSLNEVTDKSGDSEIDDQFKEKNEETIEKELEAPEELLRTSETSSQNVEKVDSTEFSNNLQVEEVLNESSEEIKSSVQVSNDNTTQTCAESNEPKFDAPKEVEEEVKNVDNEALPLQDQENPPDNEDRPQEDLNEQDEGLNILRILQNNVILQIADELIQINVINTNDRKIISVIALSDCSVVTENNNNQEQADGEEEMQVVEDNSLQENNPQDNAECSVKVEDSSEPTMEDSPEPKAEDSLEPKAEDTSEQGPLSELHKCPAKDDLPQTEDEVSININEELDLPVKEVSSVEDSGPILSEYISTPKSEEVEDSNSKIQDQVLDNLETMLEADMVPVIDFDEEANEVIIGPEESQESISEEILLMTGEGNNKQVEALEEVQEEKKIEELGKDVREEPLEQLEDAKLDGCIQEEQKKDVETIVPKASEDGEAIKGTPEVAAKDLLLELKNIDCTVDERSKSNASDVRLENEESKISSISEVLPELKPDSVEEEPRQISKDDKTNLPEDDIKNLEESLLEVPCDEANTKKTKSENQIVNEPIENVPTILKGNYAVELERHNLAVRTKKIITKASVKLIENNFENVREYSDSPNDLKESVDKEEDISDKNVKDKPILSERLPPKREVETDKYELAFPIINNKISPKKTTSPKIVIKPIKRKLITENLSAGEDIQEANVVPKSVKIVDPNDNQNGPSDDKEISEETLTPKTPRVNEVPKTPHRPKIPGVDKLKTEFVIPKRNNAAPNASPKTIQKKAKLVSFSTIVDEIKDKADAARDRKSLTTSTNPTTILKQSTNISPKKPVNKKRETRSLSETQPKKLAAIQLGSNCRRHSIAGESKNVASAKKAAQPKKSASNESLAELPKVENTVAQSSPKKVVVNPKTEEPIPKCDKKVSKQRPLETIIARISKDAKNAASAMFVSPSVKQPRDISPILKKNNSKHSMESPKISAQDTSSKTSPKETSNVIESASIKHSTSEIKVSGIEPLSNKQLDSPKAEPDLIFKKESNSPKKYTKVKVFKTRMNSFDQRSPEIKVKTKAELKEAIHLDLRDEPAVLHIESIISEKINQEFKEKFLNACAPSISETSSKPPKSLEIVKPSKEILPVENSTVDKEDDSNRKRLSLKEYNNRKRKISCCTDSPVAAENPIDSPLQNLNPEPPDDDLPSPPKVPSIEPISEPTTSFVSRIESSPNAEDMNIAAPTTPIVTTTPQSTRSTSSYASDDYPLMETIELQLVRNNRSSSIEDQKELISKKLDDLLVTIPIGQKSDNLMKRFFNREQLSSEEMSRAHGIIKFKKAKEDFFKESTASNSITSGLGIKPLESYRKLNFDIASDISIPVQLNDSKPFEAKNVPSRSSINYKKLNFDIASDISIPSTTNVPFGFEKLPPPAKPQVIDSEPVFKRLQAELLNSAKLIGINKHNTDKAPKPITKINRPIDSAVKVQIKPSFLSSTTSDGKDIIQDNGDSVYEISSSTNTETTRRNSSPTDELKIHLRKVSPSELTPTRKRRRKRFRNLYSADTESSDETSTATSSTSTSNSPAVVKTTSSTDEHIIAYSVICSGTVAGLPKIIIKRTNSNSDSSNKVSSSVVTDEANVGDLGLQPVVRLVRNPRLDNLAKRKRKG